MGPFLGAISGHYFPNMSSTPLLCHVAACHCNCRDFAKTLRKRSARSLNVLGGNLTATQSTTLLVGPPFSMAHPQDSFSLRNGNQHPLNRDWRPSTRKFFCRVRQKSPLPLYLEAKVVLKLHTRKRGAPCKGGTLHFPPKVQRK